MATPGELVQTIARVAGIQEETISWCARNLREVGLITKGGRGRSAAKMKPEDATNLLLGVMAASKVSEAASIVPLYRQATACLAAEYQDRFSRICTPGTQFGDAVDSIIREMCELGAVVDEGTKLPVTRMEIEIHRPDITGIIRLWDGNGPPWIAKFQRQNPAFDGQKPEDFERIARSLQIPDMRVAVSVGELTIEALAEVLTT